MVVPREVLIEEGWGNESEVSDANLYFFVRSLRAKITQPGETELLHNDTRSGIFHSERRLLIAYRSISLRLTIWFSAVFFAGLVLFGAVMWLDLKDTLTSGRSRTLERRTNRLGDLLRETQADPPSLRARKLQAFADATGNGLIEVFDANGTRALPSPTAAQAFPWPHITPMKIDRFSEVKFQGQTYRILAHPVSLDSQSLVLYAAAPLENNRLVLGAFSVGLLWAIPALLAISALGGYALSRSALRPVDQIVAATRSISVTNLSARLPVPETRDELQRLSETQNEMLARLESAVKEIKRFTDDASHELRSPVCSSEPLRSWRCETGKSTRPAGALSKRLSWNAERPAAC